MPSRSPLPLVIMGRGVAFRPPVIAERGELEAVLSGVALLGELRARGVDLYLHQQGLDTSTPADKAMLQMLGVFAEFERAMIVERVQAGLRRAGAQGKKLGRPRVGEKGRACDPLRARQGSRRPCRGPGRSGLARGRAAGASGTVTRLHVRGGCSLDDQHDRHLLVSRIGNEGTSLYQSPENFCPWKRARTCPGQELHLLVPPELTSSPPSLIR
jgi:Resolvase, N terminal domain